MDPLAPNGELDLLDAFRHHYFRYEAIVRDVTTHATDSTVLARIGDDLDEYSALLAEATLVFIGTWNPLIVPVIALSSISPL